MNIIIIFMAVTNVHIHMPHLVQWVGAQTCEFAHAQCFYGCFGSSFALQDRVYGMAIRTSPSLVVGDNVGPEHPLLPVSLQYVKLEGGFYPVLSDP